MKGTEVTSLTRDTGREGRRRGWKGGKKIETAKIKIREGKG